MARRVEPRTVPRARKRVGAVKKALQDLGIEPERVEMFNIGASDAVRFAAACNGMTEIAKRLGPNPLRRKEAGEVK